MNNDILIVNGIAALLVLLIIWWFFGNHGKVEKLAVDKPIIIAVKEGIFEPALLQVPAGKDIQLEFLRSDASPCAAKVFFPQLNFSVALPLNQKVRIVLPALSPGAFDFSCQMGMFRGKIIVS